MAQKSNYTLCNTYWSQDYLTGIEALEQSILNDIRLLNAEKQFFEDFVVGKWQPLTEAVAALQPQTLASQEAKRSLARLVQSIKCNSILTTCQKPLLEKIHQSNEFFKNARSCLRLQYQAYSKDLLNARKILDDYEHIAKYILDNKISANRKEDKTTNSPDRVVLDNCFIFESKDELLSFMQKLKEQIPLECPVISIPGTPTTHFQGTLIMKELKKMNSKIDSSIYNSERIGQKMVELGIISEFSILSKLNTISSKAKPRKFNVDSYYYWNMEWFTSNDNKIAQYNQKTRTVDERPGIYNWFQKLRSNTEENAHTQLQLDESKFYAHYCKLEYSKVQLEKLIFKFCKAYDVLNNEITMTIKDTGIKFCEFTNTNFTSENHLIEQPNKTELIHGFYIRNNCIPFCKWVQGNDGSFTKKEFFFGNNEVNDDIYLTICNILEYLEELEQQEPPCITIYRSWRNELDFTRIFNLKRELIGEFRKKQPMENNKLILNFLASQRNNKFVVNDWVGLVRIWLFELPDSLIPSVLYSEVDSDGFEWMKAMPANNMKILIRFAEHFQWLEYELSKNNSTNLAVADLFYQNSDIPLYTQFIRRPGLQNLEDVKTMPSVLYRILCTKNHLKLLQKNTRPVAAAAAAAVPDIKIEDQTFTYQKQPRNSFHEEEFIPKAFKTSNSVLTTPEKKRNSASLGSSLIQVDHASDDDDDEHPMFRRGDDHQHLQEGTTL